MKSLRVEVGPDFQQFTVSVAGADADNLAAVTFSDQPPAHLLQWVDKGWLTLMAASPHMIDLHVEVHDSVPEPLADSWDEIVEVSLVATDFVRVQNFAAPPDAGTTLPLTPGTSYRVRYAIGDIDASRSASVPTSNLLQLWPAAPTAPRVVRSTTDWGLYWRVSKTGMWSAARVKFFSPPAASAYDAAKSTMAAVMDAVPHPQLEKVGTRSILDHLMRSVTDAYMNAPVVGDPHRDARQKTWIEDEKRLRESAVDWGSPEG